MEDLLAIWFRVVLTLAVIGGIAIGAAVILGIGSFVACFN